MTAACRSASWWAAVAASPGLATRETAGCWGFWPAAARCCRGAAGCRCRPCPPLPRRPWRPSGSGYPSCRTFPEIGPSRENCRLSVPPNLTDWASALSPCHPGQAAAGAGGTSGANALVKGESTGGLNRTLHPHAHSDTNHISRWYSVAKISSPRRGSLKLPLLSSSREASPSTAHSRILLHHTHFLFIFILLLICPLPPSLI